MDVSKFRLDFPEFNDPGCFSEDSLSFWGELAELEISSTRFGAARPYAVELLTAHYMGIARLNSIGSTPGTGGGLVASKTVGSASISYDNSSVKGVQGSAYNGTRYGAMLANMMRRYGAGAVQL